MNRYYIENSFRENEYFIYLKVSNNKHELIAVVYSEIHAKIICRHLNDKINSILSRREND